MRLIKQFNIQREGPLAVLLLILFVGSLPMAYEIQMVYAVSTAGLFGVLAFFSANKKYKFVFVVLAILVFFNGIVSVSRDILRPYEALSFFGLLFLHFLWKKKPKMAQWIVERLAIFLIFITYAAFLMQFSIKGFDLFSGKNLSGVFFERGFMAVLLFLAALSLNTFFRASVVPLLIVSGSVFGIFAAFILGFLVFTKLKFVQAIVGIVVTLMLFFFMVAVSSVSFEERLELVADLPIVERLTQGERHNINTRSLIRAEYDPIRHFYYEPKLGTLLLGVGSQDIANGVPHNKLAELGLVSFAIFKLWEFLLLLDLMSKSGSFKKILAIALWLMLSGYIFAIHIPPLFLLLAGLFQRMKSNSTENAYTVNQRIAADHGQ